MDDTRVPRDVLDAAMNSQAGKRLVEFMARARNEFPTATERWMRADISSLLAEALIAWCDPPGPRTIDLRDGVLRQQAG